MSSFKSLPSIYTRKRPLQTDSQTSGHRVIRVKNEQPAYMVRMPNELVELIFLHLPPRVILRCLRVCKLFRSIVTKSPRIQAMLHFRPISMSSNDTQSINPFLNRIFRNLPVRGEKFTFKYLDRVEWDSGSHPVKLRSYYETTEGKNATKQSRTNESASWKRMSLGTPGQPIRIRFVRASEIRNERFNIEEWEVYCGGGLTIPEFQEIYEEHRAMPWGHSERSHRFSWEFLCKDKTLWMNFNTEEQEFDLNKVKKCCGDISSWQDDIRIWHINKVPRCEFIHTACYPLADIDSDDDFEEE